MTRRRLLLALVPPLLGAAAATAAPAGAPVAGDVVLRGAIVHVGDGRVLGDADVVIRGGRIAAVGGQAPGQPIDGPPGARIVDCAGRHVTPGLFASDTVLGLTEISAVRATQDTSEVGRVNPHVAGWTAFNPDSELLPVAMANGVLHAVVAPKGGLVSGTSAVMRLSGWTREDMALRQPAALAVTWPDMSLDRSPDAKPDLAEQQARIDAALDELEDLPARARSHRAGRSARGLPPLARDVRLEAMEPVLSGEIPVVVEAETVPQIRAALAWARRHGIRLVLRGAREAHRLAPEIAQAGVPVIVGGVRALPAKDHDPYDACWERPVLLHRAGVKVLFNVGSDAFGAAMVRNLPDEAAMTIPWGMPPEEALRAITLSPAEVFGVADQVGSIAAGKQADLVVWDGPPLEITSHAERVFMRGEELPHEDRHVRLYRKYAARPAPPPSPAEGQARPPTRPGRATR